MVEGKAENNLDERTRVENRLRLDAEAAVRIAESAIKSVQKKNNLLYEGELFVLGFLSAEIFKKLSKDV